MKENLGFDMKNNRFSLPWDQTTLWGYFSEVVSLIGVIIGYFIPISTILMLFVSMCLYHRAFYEIFEHSIDQFQQQNNGESPIEDQCEMKSIDDLIHFHISVKE